MSTIQFFSYIFWQPEEPHLVLKKSYFLLIGCYLFRSIFILSIILAASHASHVQWRDPFPFILILAFSSRQDVETAIPQRSPEY